ncbi:MAG: hypothetical protein NDI82_02005 [Anaeromyxobacteraceae bacterium]|nr:hypothetical protein [Anaeromyxobacteraceae bacterium]
MKFQVATLAAALLFVLAASMAGEHRGAALTGATIAGATAVVSIYAMGRAAKDPASATRSMLAVMALLFLVRLVLVGVGTVLVGRGGAIAYVVSFFVPYFAFTAFEGAYLHSLRRLGTTA